MENKPASPADLAVDHAFIQWVKHPNHESNAFWNKWLQENPDKATILEEARRLVLLLSQEEDQDDDRELDLIWHNLTEARRSPGSQGSDMGKVVSLRFWQNRKLLSVAAIGLLLLLSGIAFFQFKTNPRIEYATNFGEKRTIQLPDNSVIVLNANSVVSIPQKWPENGPREVQLRGEAFFSVVHTASHQSFTVTTSEGTKIDVLGTEFNVYDRGKQNRVVLASGKVRLEIGQGDETRQLDMSPGEMVSITAATEVSRKQVKAALYTSWKDDKVYFDDYTLGEVATMLEQNYGYQVVFKDTTLINQKMTAYLEVKGMEDILTTISETFEVEVTRRDNQILISSL